MKILMLIDMSPLSIMLVELGKHLASRGHVVEWACESRIPLLQYDLAVEGKVYYLTDYSGNPGHSLVSHTSVEDIGYIMFSNYDRDAELGVLRPGNYDHRTSQHIFKYFDSIFSEARPDAVIYENVSNSFSYAAYVAARQHGKQYFGLIGSRIPGRFEIWPTPFGIQECISKKMRSTNDDCPSHAEEFSRICIEKRRPPTPDYMLNNPSSHDKSYLKHYIEKIKSDPRVFNKMLDRSGRKEGKGAVQSLPLLEQKLARLKRNIKRKWTLRHLRGVLDWPRRGEKYLIYPLHYHPESSTSVLAPMFVDEDVVVKNLAFNIPNGYMLYVKDHPNAAGFKSIEFYKKIQSLPNVRLIDYRCPTEELVENSEGVVTLTSTMGFEALLRGKRVYCLGEAFYMPHKMCTKLTCPNEINAAIKSGVDSMSDEDILKENRRFTRAYFLCTHEGRLVTEKNSDLPINAQKVADVIDKLLKETE